jgi:hypothetical protein
MMQKQQVLINHVLEMNLYECSDVQNNIYRMLVEIEKSIDFDICSGIPEKIVRFRYFRRQCKQSMFLFEDACEDVELRKMIHDYCEKNRFYARTKYKFDFTEFSIRTDCCHTYYSNKQFAFDYNEGDPLVYCDGCENDYGSSIITKARYKDDPYKGKKNTKTKKIYKSTGIMLIVDTRSYPQVSYRKFAVGEDENWRKKK